MALSKDRLAQAVDKFLSTGEVAITDLNKLAVACDKRVRSETQVSTANSIKLGQQFVKRAEVHAAPMLPAALRALGWAFLVAGNYSLAEKTYLRVRNLLRRDPLSRGRIDRVLIDIYMYLGDLREARRRARMALATFRGLKAASDIAKTNVNYANLLHRQDRHRDAKKLYQEAGAHFVAHKQHVAAALCFYNLANSLVQLFDFKTAAQHFRRARKIFEKHDHRLYSTSCLYGLSWLHMLEGDFHTALQELAECEEEYRKGELPRELVLCRLDRAESYLGLNLYIDARDAAEQAASDAARLGIKYERAKALFFGAKASLGLGRTRDARKALREANRLFTQEKNAGFLGAVRFLQVQMDTGRKADLSKLSTVRKSFRNAQLPLWEAICDLQILADCPADSLAGKRLARNKAVKTVPHLLARQHTLLGDREARRRRMESALNHWTKAANILDAVRAKLPPVEMRSAFFGNQSDPYRRLIESESDRDPLKAAVWSEKYKTAGLWSPSDEMLVANPARRQVEESLSELAMQVAAVSTIPNGGSGRRTMVARSHEVFDRLGRQVSTKLASLEKRRNSQPESFAHISRQIKDCSNEQPIAQFHVGTQDILAFVHHQGDTRICRYPDGAQMLRDLVARWRFHVECSPVKGKRKQLTHLADEENILRKMSNWLLSPLELPSSAGRLLVLPEGQLSSLPWAALPHNGESLLDCFELLFAPSFRHFVHARRQTVKSRDVRIFVGESHGLPHIRDEVAAVLSRSSEFRTESYDPCRRSDWPNDSSAKIWHFTGHASLRSDNPFYSALMLADGPMFAADFRLRRNRVKVVTLAACRTGQHTSLPGEESAGLVRALLEMGAQNVVASNWAISDLSTSLWMDIMYKYYLSGSSIGYAVKQAAQGVREKFPSAYNWAAFSVFGSG